MKKIIITALLSLFALVGVAGDADIEINAAKCFAEMPAELMPAIGKNVRLDMLDYFHAGSSKPSTNTYDGDCRIIAEDSVSISYQIGNGIYGQLFIINSDNPAKLAIGVITTVEAPMPDSSIKFYDSRWGDVTDRYFREPVLADWLTVKPNADLKAALNRELPFIMASYAFDSATGKLTATNHMDQYFQEGDPVLEILKKTINLKIIP